MRLASFQLVSDPTYRPRAGLVVGGQVVDLRGGAAALGLGKMPSTAPGLLSAGPQAQARARRLAELAADPDIASRLRAGRVSFSISEVRLLAPLGRLRKNMFAVGQNYKAHAAEAARMKGVPLVLPKAPSFFTKTSTSIIGPYDPIKVDLKLSEQWDWEGELGVVIGRKAKNLSPEDALSTVFGYCCVNDVTARDFQRKHVQSFKGKSMDDCSPMGPWIVTSDEFGDPQATRVITRVNGEIKQDGSTSDMIFSVAAIIHFLSRGTTLEPGDVIATGTPPGVGYAREPAEFLRPGDLLETEIEGLGTMRNEVAEAAE